jgi:2-keto-4-pentenoate hydratase/2-oxohepta-3-ene-1,7-dioic acid hydratase in catechol pathway
VNLVLFTSTARQRPGVGVLVAAGVVDVSGHVTGWDGMKPQQGMRRVIDDFDTLRPAFEAAVAAGPMLALGDVTLLPPLPRPSKILCCIGNYWEHAQRDARPLNMFLKSPEAIIGPGGTVVLPDFDATVFHHEAELALVIKGPAKDVPAERWQDAVFGYTGFIDVSARGEGRLTWRAGSFLGKSFDTFAPIGPCITTRDAIADPNRVRVRFWVNGEPFHDYTTDDMEHRVPELIAFATGVMTLNSGDLIACGTNHEGLGPLQDGDHAVIDVEGVGRMEIDVRDPLKREWPRGIYHGPDSTARTAVPAGPA